ncbi:MAG: hypothetical protein ACREJN_11675 [Nitrospiraceae bacterium]
MFLKKQVTCLRRKDVSKNEEVVVTADVGRPSLVTNLRQEFPARRGL